MHPSLRPSKQFIVRGSIAIGIVAIVLIVQTDWFRSLIHKKPLEKLPPGTTVGDLVRKDSNQNGIPDWEEKLWGLDPTVLYTNGVTNQQIIEEKKKALGITSTTNTEPENETDQVARELFAITSALGSNDAIDDSTMQAIAAKLSTSIDTAKIQNRYSLKDIRTVPTTSTSLRTYYQAMQKKIAPYQTNTADIDVVIQALETGDSSRLPELTQSATQYKKLAQEFVTVQVPVGAASYHLAIVNGFVGVADSFSFLQEIDTNATNALIGVAIYKQYRTKLETALAAMEDYLNEYGILSS